MRRAFPPPEARDPARGLDARALLEFLLAPDPGSDPGDVPAPRPARARPPLAPGFRSLPLRATLEALPAWQRRSRITREHLMSAVEAVVRERGLERTTVRAIAARAGVAVGTIYRRFPNKRALILAVQRRFLARRTQQAMLGLRLKRQHARSVERALAQFVNGAILAVERDRPLLRAFAADASSDREILAGLVGVIKQVVGRSLRVPIALDVLFSTIRALILDGALPSGARDVRSQLTWYLSAVVRPDR